MINVEFKNIHFTESLEELYFICQTFILLVHENSILLQILSNTMSASPLRLADDVGHNLHIFSIRIDKARL